MQISRQRIRLAVDTSQMGSINDVLTAASPQFWNGVDLEFELGFFWGAALLDVSNLDSITVDLKASDPRTGLPLMSQTINSGALNNALTLDAWNGGAAADCHALVQFANTEANLDLNGDNETFWLVISALTGDSPAHKIVLGATPLNVQEGGEGVTPPSSVVQPTYYTAAQSDARYQQTVDLTTIGSNITTLQGQVGSLNAGALLKTGGTMSGALTITGLSGVLKAASGLVAGSATTGDLTEGSNLYWTSARFAAALAAVSGAASGVCPLDGSSLVPPAYLPAAFTRNIFSVSSQSAMLALSAHQGDVAVRSDLNQTFVLSNNTPGTLGNWVQLLTPASAVTSVNGATGVVTLTTANVTENTNLYYTTARARGDAIGATLTGFSAASGGTVGGGDTILTALGKLENRVAIDDAKTTTGVSEGTNLYYTSARARADAIGAALTGFSAAAGGTVTSGDTILSALGKFENRVALDDAKVTGGDRVKLDGSAAMTGALTFSGATNAGVVLSNLTSTQRNALTPANGMVVYDSTLALVLMYNGSWIPLAAGGGATWLSGTGAPAGGTGANGAYYLDTNTGNVYLKTSGTWSAIYSPGNAAGNYGSEWVTEVGTYGGDGGLLTTVGGANVIFHDSIDLATHIAGNLFIDGACNLLISSGGVIKNNNLQVVGPQQAAIPNDSSGAANQATVNAILAALRAHGLIAT